MIQFKYVALAVSAILLPIEALSANEPQAPASSEANPEKVICRTQLSTGSLTRRTRSCRTAKEWADLKQQTREQVEKMQQVGAKYE